MGRYCLKWVSNTLACSRMKEAFDSNHEVDEASAEKAFYYARALFECGTSRDELSAIEMMGRFAAFGYMADENTIKKFL